MKKSLKLLSVILILGSILISCNQNKNLNKVFVKGGTFEMENNNDNNYLYAVHNALTPQISRFSLNKDATHIESCTYFEKNTLNLNAPSTGVLVDNYFYFIATNCVAFI